MSNYSRKLPRAELKAEAKKCCDRIGQRFYSLP